MSRRQVAFLIVYCLVLSGLTSCSCRNNNRVRYVGPPPGIGPCDRCAANGPMPPRYVPNAPSSVAVPAVPAPGGAAVPAPSGVAVPGTPSPFTPDAAATPGSVVPPPPSPALQQNNYVPPGAAPSPQTPAAPRADLQQPEAATPQPEARSYPPQTLEPPRASDSQPPSPEMPVDIPQFSAVKTNIANGQEPFTGGITWLKSHGYRTVLHIRSPAEEDSAARKQFEQNELRYLSLEVSPQTLSKKTVEQFSRLVSDPNNLPLFVYDKDGSLAGALWYLHFRLTDQAGEEKAREEAERLGFKQDRSEAHLKMWLAVQNLLKELKP